VPSKPETVSNPVVQECLSVPRLHNGVTSLIISSASGMSYVFDKSSET
jgi:hypothetical protein